VRYHGSRRRARSLAIGIVGVAVLAMVAGAAVAGVVSSLGVAPRTVAGKPVTIVVDRRGDSIYELSGESLAHLRCISAQCLKAWPPVLTRSQSATVPKAAGVPGKLTILRRVRANLYQVMLDNHPLYFYSGDTKITDTKGQGIKGPGGGTWHVVKSTVMEGGG
jgi:predicted lipoprotein with Yx(FWY)xxD motif